MRVLQGVVSPWGESYEDVVQRLEPVIMVSVGGVQRVNVVQNLDPVSMW